MSRMDSTPATSPPSITTRWRKPPRTIAAAASSSDQSGAAKTRSEVRWSATSSASGSWPAPIDVEDVALGEDAGPGRLGVEHDGGADAALGHEPRGLAQRVAGPHGQDHRAHAVPDLHPYATSSATACNDCRKLPSVDAVSAA